MCANPRNSALLAARAARAATSRAIVLNIKNAASCSPRSEEHTSELQSHLNLVCRLLLETKKHTSELQSHLNLVCRLLLEKKSNLIGLRLHTHREYGIHTTNDWIAVGTEDGLI